MSKAYKCVIFDLGGVLIDWNPRYVYRQIFDTEDEVEKFLSEVTTMERNVQQDAGRTLADATEMLKNQHCEWHKEIEAYYDRWEEMLGGPIDSTVRMLREILDKGKHKVYALTNWSAETFPKAQALYDFLGWFEGIVVSGEEGWIKPNAELYQVLYDRYELDPSECLFIDDNPDNVAGSKATGMDAIQYVDEGTLRKALEERGVL